MRLRTANRRRARKRYRPYVWSSARVALRSWWKFSDARRQIMAAMISERIKSAEHWRPVFITTGIDIAEDRIEIEVVWPASDLAGKSIPPGAWIGLAEEPCRWPCDCCGPEDVARWEKWKADFKSARGDSKEPKE